MKERLYDRLNRALDRKGLGDRRDRLVGSLTGDVLEIGAGTGLNLPRPRRGARLAAIEPDPACGLDRALIKHAIQGTAVKRDAYSGPHAAVSLAP